MLWENLLREAVHTAHCREQQGPHNLQLFPIVWLKSCLQCTPKLQRIKKKWDWLGFWPLMGIYVSRVTEMSFRTLRSELLEQLHKSAALWRSNGTGRNNWNVYRSLIALKAQAPEAILTVAAHSVFPSTETPPTCPWALGICLTSWFPSLWLLLSPS